MKYISFFIFLTVSAISSASEYEFLPLSHSKLAIEFNGETQAGKGYHRLSLLQLGFLDDSGLEVIPTEGFYLIYDSQDRYGPTVLRRIKGHSPYIQKVAEDLVQVEYASGAKGHSRQIWKLLGHTAELVSEDVVAWNERSYIDQ